MVKHGSLTGTSRKGLNMKRFTEPNNLNYTVGKAESNPNFYIDCLRQLSKYEDTGLVPEQIVKLVSEYKKLKAERTEK